MESGKPELVAALELENERLRIALKNAESRAIKGRDKCFYCGKRAIVLCDWAYTERGTSKLTIDGRTCDLPLCEDHKHQLGGLIWGHGANGSFVDTEDLCPRHYNQYKATGETHGPAPMIDIEKKIENAINIIQL